MKDVVGKEIHIFRYLQLAVVEVKSIKLDVILTVHRR